MRKFAQYNTSFYQQGHIAGNNTENNSFDFKQNSGVAAQNVSDSAPYVETINPQPYVGNRENLSQCLKGDNAMPEKSSLDSTEQQASDTANLTENTVDFAEENYFQPPDYLKKRVAPKKPQFPYGKDAERYYNFIKKHNAALQQITRTK